MHVKTLNKRCNHVAINNINARQNKLVVIVRTSWEGLRGRWWMASVLLACSSLLIQWAVWHCQYVIHPQRIKDSVGIKNGMDNINGTYIGYGFNKAIAAYRLLVKMSQKVQPEIHSGRSWWSDSNVVSYTSMRPIHITCTNYSPLMLRYVNCNPMSNRTHTCWSIYSTLRKCYVYLHLTTRLTTIKLIFVRINIHKSKKIIYNDSFTQYGRELTAGGVNTTLERHVRLGAALQYHRDTN